MSTRRRSFLVLLLALAAVPSVSLAQRTPPTPAPLHWEMVVDRATYDVVDLDPPVLPAAPGRLAVHYAWQENDKIEQWWEQVVSGNREPKNVILFVKRGTSKAKKTLISYALDGVRLTAFKGPALSRTGGYDGPSTAVFSFTDVRVLPH
ncbi:MAG TPA: hypothetical protein VN603_01060 [Candidatus Acidoferrales bacterium]|jgi:hypothetical protein|nr:hypothetical protein [Candidatus Acidoferrales bacterium]